MISGLYSGEVVHQRFAPRQHRLRYRIFQVLLDLDRLDEDLKPLRWLSRNRFNLFGFYDRDHGPDQADHVGGLRDRMVAMLSDRGAYEPGDGLFLLTMPRVLGFVFNPICLYFVTRPDHNVRAVVYEVNNTFGDRHSYVMSASDGDESLRHSADKRLHVSPFMDMRGMHYDFALTAPGARFKLDIQLRQMTEGMTRDMLYAGFAARRLPLDDATLWRLFWELPLMTLKVVAGIHWEAVRIALKGIGLKPKPPTPRSSVSVHLS